MWHGGREEKLTEGFRSKTRKSEIALRHRRRSVILHSIVKKHNGRIFTGLS